MTVRERRQTLRNSEAAIENAVARIKRLRPQILLINANQAIDEYCDLLFVLRYECPDTQAILIINEAVEENYLLETLACGARGFVTDNLDSLNFSKVIDAINRGEAWVSRKLVGKIMHQIVSASRNDFIEAGFDSSCCASKPYFSLEAGDNGFSPFDFAYNFASLTEKLIKLQLKFFCWTMNVESQ
jgi:DNA-binding NarL/FixJ family response regulator